MAMTAEKAAAFEIELEAVWEEICGRRPKPKVIAREDRGVIRDADVHVSRIDPNGQGQARVIQVRRRDFVTVDLDAYEQQQRVRERARMQAAQRRDDLDPYGIGLYGPTE